MEDPGRPEAGQPARERARSTPAIAGIALVTFVLAAVCAPLSPLFDPDEGYYPATAAETLRTGSFWDLRFNAAPRWDKPILSYAFIEIALSASGESVTAARLPSAVEGAVLVALIGMLVARLANARSGILSAAVVGTTLGVSIFSRVAHPELAVVTSVIAVELLFCVWLTAGSRRARRRATLGAGIALGMGVLAKGPVAAILPLLTILGVLPFLPICRSRLRSLAGACFLCAIVAMAVALPWYAAMTLRHGVTFLREAVWQQNVGRYTSEMYGHESGVGSLIVPAFVALFPWMGFLAQAFSRVSPGIDSARGILRTTMCVSAITAFAFYSLSRSALPSYVLASVPPLGVMIALWLDEELDKAVPGRAGWIQTAIVLGVVSAALLSAPVWAGALLTARQLLGAIRPEQSDVGALLTPIVIPLGALLAAAAASLLWIKRLSRRIVVVAALGGIAPILALVCAQPILHSMYPWEVLGAKIPPGHGRLWLVGRRAPSLTFYARRSVFTVPNADSLGTLMEHEREGWLALTRDDWTQLSRPGASTQVHATVVAERGRMLLVRFYGCGSYAGSGPRTARCP